MKIRNFTSVKTLFWNNINIRQTIFKNTFWLGLSEGITKLLKLVLLIYVARILGALEYGKFSFAFAFVGIFAVLSELGVPTILIREFSREKEKEKDFFSIISLEILLNLGTLFLIFIGSFFITTSPQIQKIIWILAVYTSLNVLNNVFCSFFRARQQMEYEAITKIIQVLILSGLGIFILFYFPSVINLSYGYLFASIVALIFILIVFFLKFGSLKIEWDVRIWKKYLAMSWPLALVGFLSAICGQTDSVMMGYWNQTIQTGWYNAAYRIAGATIIPAVLISSSFYPALSEIFKQSKERLQRAWDSQMKIMSFLSFPTVVGGIVLAPKIIDFIYDPRYMPSILAFQILIVMAGISIFSFPFQHLLVIFNQQKRIFWITLGGAITNIFLNLFLIPRFSLYGAAAATVVTSLLISILFFIYISKFTSIQSLNSKFFLNLTIVIFSTLIMYFIISYPKIYNLNVLFSTLIGFFVYSISFLGLKFILKNIYGDKA